MNMNFDHIILEPEQKDLFIQIAEALKSIPRDNRGSMIEANSKDETCLVMPNASNIILTTLRFYFFTSTFQISSA